MLRKSFSEFGQTLLNLLSMGYLYNGLQLYLIISDGIPLLDKYSINLRGLSKHNLNNKV